MSNLNGGGLKPSNQTHSQTSTPARIKTGAEKNSDGKLGPRATKNSSPAPSDSLRPIQPGFTPAQGQLSPSVRGARLHNATRHRRHNKLARRKKRAPQPISPCSRPHLLRQGRARRKSNLFGPPSQTTSNHDHLRARRRPRASAQKNWRRSAKRGATFALR